MTSHPALDVRPEPVVSEWRREIGGYPWVSATFEAQGETAALRGLAAWIEYREQVFQILGYTSSQR
jgi:hypothetical protein